MMNAEIKKQWLDALRSGKYEQVTDKLYDGRNGTIRCCALGVLDDLSGLGQWSHDGVYEVLKVDYVMEDVWADYVYDNSNNKPELRQFFVGNGEGAEVRVPTEDELDDLSDDVKLYLFSCVWGEEEGVHAAVQAWAGLDSNLPTIRGELGNQEITEAISAFNDKGMSFAEIADLIEAQL